MAWHVYIIESRDKSLYTGIALDIKRRFQQHAAGKGSKYLRAKLPIKLVYFEKHRTKSAALKREAAIKRLARAKKLSLTRAGGPEKRVNWL